jgi:hypothetical protein
MPGIDVAGHDRGARGSEAPGNGAARAAGSGRHENTLRSVPTHQGNSLQKDFCYSNINTATNPMSICYFRNTSQQD